MKNLPERVTAVRDGSFVVFVIGARFNKWWALPVVLGVALAMRRMQRELLANPDSGLLAQESFGTVTLQYWRSLDELLAYAKDKERAHVPAWQRWIRQWGLDGAVGIFHETYVIEPGHYENVYVNMPPWGLGRAARLVPAEGPLRTARGRLEALAPSQTAAAE